MNHCWRIIRNIFKNSSIYLENIFLLLILNRKFIFPKSYFSKDSHLPLGLMSLGSYLSILSPASHPIPIPPPSPVEVMHWLLRKVCVLKMIYLPGHIDLHHPIFPWCLYPWQPIIVYGFHCLNLSVLGYGNQANHVSNLLSCVKISRNSVQTGVGHQSKIRWLHWVPMITLDVVLHW